ncbi:CAP domain-containing protein [Ganoderma leucocontextum]|nr:CAP domain-containing protein [Ganoderma leucocontextum]
MMNRLAFFFLSLPILLPLLVGVEATSKADISAYLTAHNSVREKHGAADLKWNNTLASAAQTWVNKCVFKHSGGSLGPYGENLAAGTGNYAIAAAVKGWTNEVSEYNAQSPKPSHFTQVVWKNTKQVGCAVHDCSTIFPPKYGVAKFYACEYYPVGNVLGEFPQNVQA